MLPTKDNMPRLNVLEEEKMMFGIRKWLDHKLGVDVYELRDEKIVKDHGRDPAGIVALQDVIRWHIDYEMVFDVITIWLKDGRELRWLDKYNDLIAILRSRLLNKEDCSTQAP